MSLYPLVTNTFTSPAGTVADPAYVRADGINATDLTVTAGESGKVGFKLKVFKGGVATTAVAVGAFLPATMTTSTAIVAGDALAWTGNGATQGYDAGHGLVGADLGPVTTAFAVGDALPNGVTAAAAVAPVGDDISTREYRVMYTDSSTYVSTYTAQNAVFIKKFKISSVKVISADPVFSDLSMEEAGVITGSITGLNNGSGYGFKFTNMAANSTDITKVGIGANIDRVIVNAGPNTPADNFRVVIKKRDTGNAKDCKITINLAESATVTHSTGRNTDVNKVRLIVTNMHTLESSLHIIAINETQRAAGGPIVLDQDETFPSDVDKAAFEYALATEDIAGAISEYASTIHASSESNRASNVQNLLVDASSNSGTEMKVTWDTPVFSGAPITGYRVYYQEQSKDQADWAAADVSGNDVSGNKAWYWNIARATQFPTFVTAGSERKVTITGLTNQSKYVAWVRAVHAAIDPLTNDSVLGNIGRLDLNKAPTVTASENGTWGGYFPDISSVPPSREYSSDYYFTNATDAGHKDAAGTTTGQEFADIVRGKPRKINTSTLAVMSLHNGLDISSGTPTNEDMRKSLAIKWDDKALDFGGLTTGKKLQYFAAKAGAFTDTELNAVIDASFEDVTLPDGSKIGTGTWADSDDVRYVMFNDATDVTIANDITATSSTMLTKVHNKANGDLITPTETGLVLGESYTFLVALKNTIGLGEHSRLGAEVGKKVVGPPDTQKFNLPWSIVGRNNSSLTDATEMKEGPNLGTSARDLSNCLFDVTTQSFQITIADDLSGNQKDIEATGALENIDYEVKVDVSFGDMTAAAKEDLCLNAIGDDISNGFFPMTKSANTDGSIRLSFDSVLTKGRYDSWTPAAGVVNPYGFKTRKLSEMKGVRYTITIRAKNSTGTSTTASQVGATRQVFGTKAAYELLEPNIDISLLPWGDDVSFTGVGGVADIAFVLRDLSDSETEGRYVDEIEYRVFQTLSSGKTHELISKTHVPAAAVYSAGTNFAIANATGKGDRIKFTNDSGVAAATGEFKIRLPASTDAANGYKMGYPIKAEFKYRSISHEDFAVTPAQAGILKNSSENYKTATKELTFTKIPEDTHDEVGSMAKEDGNNKTTISWSRPKDQYDAVLTGYIVDLYDISSGTINVAAPNTTAIPVNLSSPLTTRTSGVLASTIHTYEFTGLVNGKNYMPVVRTVTTQGTVSVTSNGRSLVQNVTDGELLRYGHDNTGGFGEYVYFGIASGFGTVNHFVPAKCARPYGLPLVSANVAEQKLTFDNNGAMILYGAMIQVQTTATTATLAAPDTSGTPSEAVANTNVFYLDLSLDALPGVSNSATYKTTDGVALPDRKVFTVNKTFLGDGWVDETNYVFVSNKAGTFAGKIDAGVHTPL